MSFGRGILIKLCFCGALLSVLPAWQLSAADCLNFNAGWRFIKADPSGAANPDFDDSGWATVSTPHTFNDVDAFSDYSPGRMLGQTNQWSGRAWYRKSFVLTDSARGRKIYIEFEAVRQVAEVWLNGHLLGASKNGFVPFGFDLTPFAQFGRTNVIAVMCDNRFMVSQIGDPEKPGAAGTGNVSTLSEYERRVNATLPDSVDEVQANQIPWNNPQWHPPLGGIYHDVRLYTADPLHIGLPLFDFLKTTGPYAYATEISMASADIAVEVPVENGRDRDEKVEVTARILDRNGHAVLKLKQEGDVAAGSHSTFRFSGAIRNPELWEPDYPYLYRVSCSVRADGGIADASEIPLGIRAVHWDVNTGFFINGRHLRLHGWGQRPTEEWPGLGSAQPDWLHFFTLQLMKDAGANFVRWGHCAGAPEMIEAGDQLGLITDQPGVDGEADTVGAPWKIRAAAFRDVIIYFRNDPSILIWEGGNQKVTREHAKELRHYVDEFDPHGGRAYSQRRADEATGAFMDVTIGTEGSHEIPRLPVVEGEYDREESPRRIWDAFSPPNFGYPEAKGQTYDLTSEEFAINEIAQFVNKAGAPGDCGGANWIFSDSTSGGRITAEVARTSGEVDGVRLPKEAYYVCQAMFRDDPQVHIIGHWNYPAGTKKTVYVASNCSDVELFVNGKSAGHGRNSEHYLFTFPDVRFESGEIKAIANDGGKPAAVHSIRTAGPPVALRMTTITGPNGLRADGSDVALIDIEAVDASGERCPTFQQEVSFSCRGPGIWRGGYDSGNSRSINKTSLGLECGINRVAVRSTLVPGDVSVSATCPGLKSATVVVSSRGFAMENGCSKSMPAMPLTALRATHPDWSCLATATPPMTVTTAAEDAGRTGRFTDAFNYSGPTELVHVEANAADGKNVYCDRDYRFMNLPQELAGADWVQAAESDCQYSAADLMQIAAKMGTTVYVAHDARLPVPEWLQRLFQPVQISVAVNGQPMKVFARRVQKGESFTLGSNAADPRPDSCNMYVVFVKRYKSDYSANR